MFPDGVLGAGLIRLDDYGQVFDGKDVVLVEGVVASGATEAVFLAGLKNRGVKPLRVDCGAVVVCPTGGRFIDSVRKTLGVPGIDRSTFVGGTLNVHWYVVYHQFDPLLKHFEYKDRPLFVGSQVLGDGGDLSSNTKI